MPKPLVSLIIVNYNGFKLSRDCLRSIYKNTKGVNFEIILVDNASNDDSPRKLKKIFSPKKNFKMLIRPKNDFLAPAYNDGFKKSSGKFIFFMNNDLTVSRNWLNPLLELLKNPKVGVVGPTLIFSSQRKIINNSGGNLNILGVGQEAERLKKYSPRQEFKEVFYASAAIMGTKRDIFKRLGGFDETYLLNYEDIDLSWRARLLGYQIMIAKRSLVYHSGASPTLTKYLGHISSAFLCRKNRLTTLLKNAGLIYLLLILLPYTMVHFLLFLKEILVDRNPNLAIQSPKALAWVWQNRAAILKKRRAIQKSRIVPEWQIIKRMGFI